MGTSCGYTPRATTGRQRLAVSGLTASASLAQCVLARRRRPGHPAGSITVNPHRRSTSLNSAVTGSRLPFFRRITGSVSGRQPSPQRARGYPYSFSRVLIRQVSVFCRPFLAHPAGARGVATCCFSFASHGEQAHERCPRARFPLRAMRKCSVFKHGTLRYT